jgi:hypothetical protein
VGAVPVEIPAVIAVEIPHLLRGGWVNTGMLDQVMVEGGRPTFLTPNNEEIGQHPGISSDVLVHTLRVPGTLRKGLSGHVPDGRR